MNGSASAPSSATMNGTRCAIRAAMKATSRERRSSLATRIGHFSRRAVASAAASCDVVNDVPMLSTWTLKPVRKTTRYQPQSIREVCMSSDLSEAIEDNLKIGFIPELDRFIEAADSNLYVPMPDGWWVGVSDVVDSTGAI